MGPLTKMLGFIFLLCFGHSLGQDPTDFKKLYKEFDTNQESLRKSHVKTYAMNVGYQMIIHHFICEICLLLLRFLKVSTSNDNRKKSQQHVSY